jgi:ankyrin repeat protein
MIKKYLFITLLPCLFALLHAQEKVCCASEVIPSQADTNTKALPGIEEKDGLGRTPLHYAAYYGSEKMVDVLLAYGAPINAQDEEGVTPLSFLCTKKDFSNLSLILMLVKNGADIEHEDNDGWRPLHKAVLHSNAGVVETLIKCGASLTAPVEESNNITVLHLAAQNNADPSIVEVLLKAYGAAAK